MPLNSISLLPCLLGHMFILLQEYLLNLVFSWNLSQRLLGCLSLIRSIVILPFSIKYLQRYVFSRVFCCCFFFCVAFPTMLYLIYFSLVLLLAASRRGIFLYTQLKHLKKQVPALKYFAIEKIWYSENTGLIMFIISLTVKLPQNYRIYFLLN